MKLAVSNVAWWPGAERFDEFVNLVAALGCEGIEFASSMFWDEPVESSREERADLRARVEAAGLVFTGLQALLYTHQEIVLFRSAQDRTAALDYLGGLAQLCCDLGGDVMVFGSPRNRNRGGLPREQADTIAIEFFTEAGRRCAECGVWLCIEPLGATETDFINSVAEASALIDAAGNPPGLGLHIDAKGLIDEGEWSAPYLTSAFSRAKHVHINDPGLTGPGFTGFDHTLISERIEGSGYDRFLSIEMRRVEPDPAEAITRAVRYARDVYWED